MDRTSPVAKENSPPRRENDSLNMEESDKVGDDSIVITTVAVEALSFNKNKDDECQLQPPSAEEARGYYNGLPSSPRLVGRTSSMTVPWPRPLTTHQPGLSTSTLKSLSPIGSHRILMCWEETVLAKMCHAMFDLEWTTIDVVRIGYSDVPVLKRPVVVWVGVPNIAHPWNTSIREALEKSRIILDEVGLHDVECEIRVSDLKLLAKNPPELMSRIQKHTLYPVSSYVGTSICPAKRENHIGSLCVYLSPARFQNGSGPLWALTCRHVALPGDVHSTDKPYKRTNTSQPAIKINSPALSDLKAECRTTEDDAEIFKDLLLNDPNDALAQNGLKFEDGILQRLELFKSEAFRQAGSVYLAPEIKQAEYWGEGRETPYLWARDWCLIELDRARFPNNGKDLCNYASLLSRYHSRSDLNRMLNTNPNSKMRFKFPQGSQLRLSGIIPMAEIRQTEILNDDGQECFIVGKHGYATKQTWGCPTEIKSIQRQVLNHGPACETREWSILGSLGDKSKAFFQPGDSGSLVFGADGRLGGILTRGTGFGVNSDITYVTPMEVILADIEKDLGFNVKVL